MELLFQFQLSMFGLVATGVLLLKIYFRKEVYSYSNKLFRAMLMNVIIIIILEFLAWAFEGCAGTTNYVLNHLFNTLLFIMSPVTIGFWLTYIHYKIYQDKSAVRKRFWFQYAFVIAFTLGIINIFYPIVFEIPRETNIYARLPMIAINYIMVYSMVFYSLFITIKERKKTKSTVFITVILFLFLPVFASVLQVLNYGLIIMYPMLGLTILVVYLFLETASVSDDYLTGIFNRLRFDEYVNSQIDKDLEFTVIMLDLDDFKAINDKLGHAIGDRVLIMFANVLSQVFVDKSLVARYGGDEFVVVVHTTNEDKVLEYLDNMRKKILKSSDQIFKNIVVSCGYSSRTIENQLTYDELLKKSDDIMYENKSNNKNRMRRKTDKESKKEGE